MRGVCKARGLITGWRVALARHRARTHTSTTGGICFSTAGFAWRSSCICLSPWLAWRARKTFPQGRCCSLLRSNYLRIIWSTRNPISWWKRPRLIVFVWTQRLDSCLSQKLCILDGYYWSLWRVYQYSKSLRQWLPAVWFTATKLKIRMLSCWFNSISFSAATQSDLTPLSTPRYFDQL